MGPDHQVGQHQPQPLGAAIGAIVLPRQRFADRLQSFRATAFAIVLQAQPVHAVGLGHGQVYLPGLMALSEAQQLDTAANVQRAVDRLRGYQLADGGFAYWPGASGAHDWATTYAGHFLLEAQRLGYAVPADMLEGELPDQHRAPRQLP